MIGSQRDEYQPLIDEWKRRVAQIQGWEEEHSEVPVADEVELWCWMDSYRWARMLEFGGMIIANPSVDIGVQAYQAKSHLNRFIGCVEDLPPELTSGLEAVAVAMLSLAERHPGRGHVVRLRAPAGLPLAGYATGAAMTQEIDLTLAARHDGQSYHVSFGFVTPMHTVCPFMLYEADGHSHTQRTYVGATIQVPFESVEELRAPFFALRPIIEELNTRLTPSQSRMKIPDEAVHCLRAYTTPTYTEFGAIQLASILRDTKHQWLAKPDRPARTSIRVRSVESIFSNDILSTLEVVL